MVHRRSLIGLAMLFIVCVSTAIAQSPTTISTADDAEKFLQTYYEKPRPELIQPLIVAAQRLGILERPHARPPYIGFLSEVIATNSDRLADWRKFFATQTQSAKSVFEDAVKLSENGGVLSVEGRSNGLNDMYWGAFFATGQPKFIAKLIEQLRLYEEELNYLDFMAGATAKWSLSSNAKRHARVKQVLEASVEKVDQNTRKAIVDLLQKDPDVIRQELFALARQRWGRHWVRPDGREVIVVLGSKDIRTHYFGNDSSRLCFRFSVPGAWQPTGELGLLESGDDKQRVGVAVYSPEDLSGATGPAAIARTSELLVRGSEQLGTPLEERELTAFDSSRPGAMKWRASLRPVIGGEPLRAVMEKVLLEIVPGWVAQISASGTSDDSQLFRDVIQSLEMTRGSECYWPLIRRQFPYIRQH